MQNLYSAFRLIRIKIVFLLISSLTDSQAQVVRITAGTNLQTAINNATAGTVFLVEAGSYGNITVNKRVALIGTGYFLKNQNSATVNYVSFEAGSENSYISGFVSTDYIGAFTNGIIIQRNYANRILVSFAGNLPIGNITIKQNYTGQLNINGDAVSGTLIKSNLIMTGIYFRNNIQTTGMAINNTILNCQSYESSSTMDFVNNIMYGQGCNIISTANDRLTYNIIIGGSHFTNANATNTRVPNVTGLFLDYPTTGPYNLDARFQLPANSPAKGKGMNGVDCGAFGGDEPYVLSGIPIGPTVLEVNAPAGATAGQTIQVQVRAKVQN